MSFSPPPEAPEFRGKTLTPVSPKPVHYPSPSNIPILEQQMDPSFHETLALAGHANLTQTNKAELEPSNPPSSESDLYDDQQSGANDGGNGRDGYSASQAESYGNNTNGFGTTAIQDVAHTSLSTAAAYGEATSALTQADRDPNPSANMSATSPATQALSHIGDPVQNLLPDAQVNGSASDGGLGGLDYQALLDTLSPSNAPAPSADAAAFQDPSVSPQTPGAGAIKSPAYVLPGNLSLPPRPPPQEKPATHPNYAPGDDIRAYHPHAQKMPGAAYRAQSGLPPLTTPGAPGATGANGMPPPPSASFQQTPLSTTQAMQSPNTPNYRQRDALERRPDLPDDDISWSPELQRLYDEFLDDERRYVTEGQWDKFPANSRLFIGNLPTEKVTKRDLFHIFHKHGKLAQISIKQAYGFVQFLDATACYRALQNEQGMAVRGRKMHLEISKPQRNTRNADNKESRGARRRSRSPDYTRGGGGQQGPRGIDRYTGGQSGASPRNRRGRDDYRPGRSPSPRGYPRGGRDRSPDRYGHRRSRSRSPHGRGRYRSPSPRRDLDDDLPLPRRAPRDVPDVQIIVLDDLDRNFIAYVEKAFQDRGVRCDVLLLSPRLSEMAVIRRQILEGVQAVSRLTRMSQQTAKIPLQVFDRRGGADNVRFEEYDNLDPAVCAELVLRAKQTHGLPQAQYAPAQAAYGMPPPSYGMPPAHYPPQQPPPNANPDISNILSSLNSADLQKLLGAVQQPPSRTSQQNAPPTPSGLTPDLARILGAAAQSAQPPMYGQQAPPAASQETNPYASLTNNPAFASLLSGAAGAPQQQQQHRQPPPAPAPAPALPQAPPGQPDMNEIMAQLAKYRR